jgi:hypothetical protein
MKWLWEKKIFDILRNIKIFRLFRKRKTFRTWIKQIRETKQYKSKYIIKIKIKFLIIVNSKFKKGIF